MSDYVQGLDGEVRRSSDGAIIPADPANVDFQEHLRWLAAGHVMPVDAAPPPTDAEVSREYERRLFAILEARDLAHAAFIRADNEAELRELHALSAPSAADSARIVELEAASLAVARLIACYNAIPTPPPADYATDARWTIAGIPV